MNNEAPRWWYVSEAARNWMIFIGGALFFLWFGWNYYTVRNLRQEVLAKIESETAEDRKRLGALENKYREEQIRRESAERALAELKAVQYSTPVLRVTPVIQQTGSYKGVREIALEAQVTNVGKAPIQVREVRLDVSGGSASDESGDKIGRTQMLWDLEQHLLEASFGFRDDKPNEEALRKEYDEIHQDCPHGQLFSLDDFSPDVTWKKVDRLSGSRKTNMQLSPGTSSSQVFSFVLTESMYHHLSWYRFEVTVTPEGHPTQKFQFTVPTGRQSEYGVEGVRRKPVEYGASESRLVKETVFRWTTESPLAPVANEEE